MRRAADQEPLAGALVSLVDQEGRVGGASMSDALGSYQIPLDSPGTYHLKFDVLGRTSALSAPFQVVQGSNRLHSFLFDGVLPDLPAADPANGRVTKPSPR